MKQTLRCDFTRLDRGLHLVASPDLPQDYLLLVLGQRLSIDVILSYIKHVFQLLMSFFATRRTGEVVSRLQMPTALSMLAYGGAPQSF